MTEAIGFIGLGSMGGAIARKLLERGTPLHVFDIDAEISAKFRHLGAHVHASPREVADQAVLVFSCLPTVSACRQVALGSEGIAHGTQVKIYAECSTIGHAVCDIADGLAERGIATLDCPVSGGVKAVRMDTLSVMAAGADPVYAQAVPYLERFGKKVFRVGRQPGQAQTMKLVNNLVSAANMAAAFEAVVFGAKAGLDPQVMVDVLNASSGRNSATQDKLPDAVLSGTYDFGAKVEVIYKDVCLGIDEAQQIGVPLWVGSHIGQVWRYAMSQGGAQDDFTTLIKHMQKLAGCDVF
ncbi:NAD(P)-dependent oxidoreductase [Alcaligenaceae bacterium]|nr:NAD(P)-dependent oxidoreductase [Alcaligenaceae bacterium]